MKKTEMSLIQKLIHPLLSERGEVGDPPDPPDPPSPPADDLSTLFSADEIKTKKETVAAKKAEEDRRSKLKPEELKAEDDKKAADAAEKEKAEAANKVPEKYADFTVPEGMEVDPGMIAEATPLFKELGLSQAKAQKVIDLYAQKIAPAFVKKQVEQWEGQKAKWLEDTKADKEIGGAKFDASVADAVRVLNTLGTPELKKVFDEYGLGNHPEFVRVFARMATHLKESSIDTDKSGAEVKQPAKSVEELADRLYADHK